MSISPVITNNTGQDIISALKFVSAKGGFNQAPELPTASSTYEGYVIQYTGITNSSYIHNRFYECIEKNNVYLWEQTSVQPDEGMTLIQIPSVSTDTYVYNGNEQGPTILSYDSVHCELTDPVMTDVGNYTLKIALKNKTTMKWKDLTTADKEYPYTITKANQTITADKSAVSLTVGKLSEQITISGASTGLVASSSNTSVATVSVNNNVVTISNVNQTNGSATITIYAQGDANHNASNSVQISMTGSFIVADPVLNNNNWSVIQYFAQKGTASNYWSVGDRKEVTLNGTVRARTLSNYKWYCYILGFNHNSSKEGNNTIHFQFGFTALSGGIHTCLTDWTSTRDHGPISGTRFCMNNTETNAGGWASSLMRNTTIPEFKNCLPSDLKSVLKSISKYTDNTGSANNTESAVTLTSDEIFLLSEYEIFGVRTSANQYEYTNGKQAQYTYYVNGNDKIMYNDQVTGTAVCWSLRSVHYENPNAFLGMQTYGIIDSSNPKFSFGFAPGFAVG